MTLGEYQEAFAERLGRLLTHAVATGYRVRIGEVYRPPETAALYAAKGTGIADSLHCLKLAADLHLFRDGQYLETFADYLPLGEWWEQQSDDTITCCWGGRFASRDCVHFSVAYQGRR